MSWEETIMNQLLVAANMAVRFDAPQDLTETQEQTARNNIGFTASATQISGNKYKIVLSF
jgi:hypothetical protein